MVFFIKGCVVNLVTETLFGGRQKLRRARSSRAFAHGACRDMAEGVEGESEQNFTNFFFTEKCSDRLVDGTARENEVMVKASFLALTRLWLALASSTTGYCK